MNFLKASTLNLKFSLNVSRASRIKSTKYTGMKILLFLLIEWIGLQRFGLGTATRGKGSYIQEKTLRMTSRKYLAST
jgi:hypothetical protein